MYSRSSVSRRSSIRARLPVGSATPASRHTTEERCTSERVRRTTRPVGTVHPASWAVEHAKKACGAAQNEQGREPGRRARRHCVWNGPEREVVRAGWWSRLLLLLIHTAARSSLPDFRGVIAAVAPDELDRKSTRLNSSH